MEDLQDGSETCNDVLFGTDKNTGAQVVAE